MRQLRVGCLDLQLPAPTARGDAAQARRLLAGAWSMVVAGGTLFALLLVAAHATGRPALLRGIGWGPPLLVLAAIGGSFGYLLGGSASAQSSDTHDFLVGKK